MPYIHISSFLLFLILDLLDLFLLSGSNTLPESLSRSLTSDDRVGEMDREPMIDDRVQQVFPITQVV